MLKSKYLAIQHFYTEKNWSMSWMCKQLDIARESYYKGLNREILKQEKEVPHINTESNIREYSETKLLCRKAK